LFKRKLTEEKGIPKRDGSRRQKAQSAETLGILDTQ